MQTGNYDIFYGSSHVVHYLIEYQVSSAFWACSLGVILQTETLPAFTNPGSLSASSLSALSPSSLLAVFVNRKANAHMWYIHRFLPVYELCPIIAILEGNVKPPVLYFLYIVLQICNYHVILSPKIYRIHIVTKIC